MWSSSRRRAAIAPLGSPLAAIALAMASACTQVHVQDTVVAWNTPVCGSNGNNGGRNGGGAPAQPPAPTTSGVMDTYMVQIFELYDTVAGADSQACEACIAHRTNCFIERSTCVCGDATSVDSGHMQEMLKGVRIDLPAATYSSLYCMRVMAVERTSPADSVSCECDATWEQPPQVRLCALSNPYAASPLPIEMDVQCSANTDKFSTCLGQ